MSRLSRRQQVSSRFALTTLLLLGGVACNTQSSPQPPTPSASQDSQQTLGLQAEYFRTTNFTGPAVRQTDAQLAFRWGRSPAAQGLRPGHLSARWSGQLTAPASGEYTLYLTAEDGQGNLTLKGRPIQSGDRFTFRQGEVVQLEAQFQQTGLNPSFRLEWEEPGKARQIIPVGQFSSKASTAFNYFV